MSNKLGLLVIDVQEDFLDDPNLTPNKSELVDSIYTLMSWARINSIPVFHIQTIISQDGSNAMPHWQENAQYKCKIDSPGASAPPLLKPLSGERIFEKQFFDAFDNPQIVDALVRNDIQTLIISGVHTHACIREAALSAYASGFKVIIPEDAVGSYDALHATQTLKWLNGRAASCITSDQVMSKSTILNASNAKKVFWSHRNPADSDQVLFEVAEYSENKIESIAKSVHAEQSLWKLIPIAERAILLKNWLSILRKGQQHWVTALILDLGKPYVDALGEVRYGLDLLENICNNMFDAEVFKHQRIYYRPHGIVALITPWNNPFAIPISKIGPALGFGNGVLWKPAIPATHLSELILESLGEAGLASLVGLVTGGANAGEHTIKSNYTAAISFTGSVITGRKISQIANYYGKALQAELGGNNAAIVLRDADIRHAAQDLATAIFSFAGQRCTAIRRIIVEKAVMDEFSLAFKKAVALLKVGSPSDPTTQIGPVISQEHHKFLLDLIEEEKANGSTMLLNIEPSGDLSQKGNWIMPTVFINPGTESKVWKQELFGPVVVLQECIDMDSALKLHNEVDFGLLGVLFSQNTQEQDRFLREAQAGILSINKARPPFSSSGPFLGWKDSGMGIPEHGRWNRDFYTKVQTVYS